MNEENKKQISAGRPQSPQKTVANEGRVSRSGDEDGGLACGELAGAVAGVPALGEVPQHVYLAAAEVLGFLQDTEERAGAKTGRADCEAVRKNAPNL